jgi:hypothetical protein
MSNKKKEVFTVTVKDEQGNDQELELALLAPTSQITIRARSAQSEAFRAAMDAGAPLRAKLEQYVRDQGIWDDIMEKRVVELGESLLENEEVLAKGGCTLQKGYDAAIRLRRIRNEIAILMAERNDLDAYTCEGQGENARFDSLVAQSIVYNDTGKPYFANLQNYLDNQDSEVAVAGAKLYGATYYGMKDDYYQNLPENQFLLKYEFCNTDLHLINKDGQLVDTFGRLVNENGVLIDHDGNTVDSAGNPVDEEGNAIIEQAPFTDEDGNPLGDDGEPIEVEVTVEVIPADNIPVAEKKTAPPKKKAVKKKAAPRKKRVTKKKTEQ